MIAYDAATNTTTSVCSTDSIIVDTIPPDQTVRVVVGSVVTGQSTGLYKLSTCADVAKVKITATATVPAYNEAGWVACDDVNYTLIYDQLVEGKNDLKFWIQDLAGNVQPTPIDHQTFYTPPQITVVNGPTITTSTASMTISYCAESGIEYVLFNETNVRPAAGDAGWQTCSTAVGALHSDTLSPGNHTLRAFFKYNGAVVSLGSISVPVRYEPPLTWKESPVINRPQVSFTAATCDGVDKILFNQVDEKPDAGAAGWQNCTLASGGLTYTLTASGSQNLNVWYKDGLGTVMGSDFDHAHVAVNFVPPTASLQGGTNLSTNAPKLSLSDCTGITKVYVKLNDGIPTAPLAGDFLGGSGQNCTTAINGINTPVLPTEGVHTLDVWFYFSDAYILASPWYSRITVSYTAPDVTPPPTATGAAVPLTITLTNGSASTTPPTLINFASRAHYTLNTCIPNPPVALNGTVSVSASSTAVVGVGTQFTTQLVVGDFVKIGTETIKVLSITDDTHLNLVFAHNAGASALSLTKEYPLDTITGMILTESAVAPSASDPDWLSCSSDASAFKSKSLSPDGDHDLYAWFKDSSGNISVTPLASAVKVQTELDETPPPRPEVIVEGAPTLTAAPAHMTVTSCSDVDQVYLEPTDYPNPYTPPSAGASGWIDCTEGVGDIIYNIYLKGSYTLSVWFKDAAGNINPIPRDVSFIFDPVSGSFTTPLAFWTFDSVHKKNSSYLDIKGHHDLYYWDDSELSVVTGKNAEAVRFSGTKSYLVTPNTLDLKPASAVTMSMWAYLTQASASTMGLGGAFEAGVGGYGFALDAGSLKFYTSGQSTSVLTSSYTTGWHHLIGTSDGRYIKLYIDGTKVSTTDLGVPANLVYGSSPIFTVGSLTDGTNNPSSSNLFNNAIDEVVVWAQYFTDQDALNHYIDTYNNNKVGEHAVKPSNIASVAFYGEKLQNIFLTISDCGKNKFVYVNETTHPPTTDTSDWQVCNTLKGGIVLPNQTQGAHELKVWGKDEYNNITAGYYIVDTAVTSMTGQAPGVLYYTFDHNHWDFDITQMTNDIFGKRTAMIIGATEQTGIQNEGLLFSRSATTSVTTNYASHAQPEGQVTLSAWVKLTKDDNREQAIAGTLMNSHGYGLVIDAANSELRFNVETSGGIRQAGVSVSSYTTGYHNVVGTYDGRYVKLYIDGASVDEVDYTTTLAIRYNCLGSFTVGAGSTCNNGPVAGTHFDNAIDEVIVWDTALTSTTLYNFFNGEDTVPPIPVSVTPKNNQYNVTIPVARLNVSTCNDIASVYVSLNDTRPSGSIANWQTCSTTGDLIKTPLLANGNNTVKVWFKDLAGNVSEEPYTLQYQINFTYDTTIPQPNSYWTMDQVNIDGSKVFDVVSSKNGVKYGPTVVDSLIEQALRYDGIDDYTEVAYDASFQPTNYVTLSVWFKTTAFDASEHVLAGNYYDGGYELVLANNTIAFRVKADSATQTISSSTGGLNASDWHHAVGVYNNGTLRLFVDGAEKLPQVVVGAGKPIEYTLQNSFAIGAGTASPTGVEGRYFSGDIDDVAFWDEALTDTVVTEMYNRGVSHDLIYYKVTPPSIPVDLSIIYYNSLVSRANLTVTDCTGLNYIILTKDAFPPDKNDPDWQLCNTLTGGLLSKELSLNDAFGKFWTKDSFGNISKTFKYVPLVNQYDKPIARPVVHWTFDNSHYVTLTRQAFDRISQINLKNDALKEELVDKNPDGDPPGHEQDKCTTQLVLDETRGEVVSGGAGVLNQGLVFSPGKWLHASSPENLKLKPSNTLSVAAWVYLTGDGTHTDEHIVSTDYNGKGWSLRLDAVNKDDKGLRFTVHTAGGLLEPYLETKNYATGWHLVIGTYDGQTAAMYFDGIFVKSFSMAIPQPIVYESSVSLMVGAKASTGKLPTNYDWQHNLPNGSYGACIDNYFPSSFFNGKIDEILVWDKVLTKLEASSLYHNGADILYKTDTTPPANPTLQLENTRSTMFSNKAYFTLSSCNDISGVLVNEGTMPDKQDERWEICRTRRGSFGLANLTNGGHTITAWFKDLAGNVTPASSDLVVMYNAVLVPYANAYWPMDASASVDHYARNVVENYVDDLMMTNINTPVNPLATHVSGKANEAINLVGSQAYLSAPMTTLLTPVNFLTVGGWFELTSADTATRTLIDEHHYASDTSRGGYKIWTELGQLKFRVELDIAKTQTLAVATSSYSTGWHHVMGVWRGQEARLYIDGAQVATTGLLPEVDYMRYDHNTPFRIGAESQFDVNPSNFLNGKVDEIGVWGYDLTSAEVANAYAKGNAGEHIAGAQVAPSNVDNAYIYPYSSFGPRARMTIQNCTNTPWVYITKQGNPPPTASSTEWRQCRTVPGAIISEELPVGTMYVDVYAKNLDGVISTVPGTKEILPITASYTLPLPIAYYSFNTSHVSGTSTFDFMTHVTATLTGAPVLANNTEGQELIIDGVNDYVDVPNSAIFDLRKQISIAIWADITNGDTDFKRLVSRYANADDTSLVLEGGYLKFKVNVTQPNNYTRSTSYPEAKYLTSKIPTGMHFITGTYDGKDLKLYVDANLVHTVNVGERNYSTDVERPIAMDQINGFRVGHPTAVDSFSGHVDELMVFNRALTNAEIASHYMRYVDANNTGDTTPPATVPSISVLAGSFDGTWTTNNANPLYTLDSCTDIAGVYVTIDGEAAPKAYDSGWQLCGTSAGQILGPTLSAGTHTVKFWFKDKYGNVSSGQTITVTYTPPATPAPIAYWSMDDNGFMGRTLYEPVNLLHAENYEGVLVAGKVGTALSFDGTRKYMEIEHSPVIKPTNEISLAFWLNIPGLYTQRAGRTVLGNRGDAPEGYAVRWVMDPSPPSDVAFCSNSPSSCEYFEFVANLAGTDVALALPQNIIGTGWQHFIVTFDRRYLKLYKNAALIKTVDLGDEKTLTYSASVTTSLLIAAKASDKEKPVGGTYTPISIDELAIWNKALYPNQVTDIYTNYSNNNTRIYDSGLPNTTPPSARFHIHNPSEKPLGSRLRLTVSDCTDLNMILVNDSLTAPAGNDENWQPCNTYAGGILSAPLSAGIVTPRVWGRSYTGTVSASSGTANDETYDMPSFVSDVPRPVAYWPLDSVASGFYNHPYVYDALYRSHAQVDATNPPVSTTVSGDLSVLEKGFSFNGVNQFIKVHPTAATNPMYDISVGAWVKLTRGETQNRHIVGNIQNMTSATGGGVGLRIKDSKLEFYVTTWTGAGTAVYNVTIDSNLYSTALHLVVGTYDGRDLKLYIDGVLVSTNSIQFYDASQYEIYHDDHSSWSIGAEAGNEGLAEAGTFYQGVIDDVMIWRTALTPEQVYYVYDYGAAFIPTNTKDGVAPTDPGIKVATSQTTLSSPWSTFTMPSCTGANGIKINAIYVALEGDPVPSASDQGWQYCSLDIGYIISKLMNSGVNNIKIYFRDEEGDISAPTTITMTYNPPTMVNPLAYYTFNADDRLNNFYVYDLAGHKHASYSNYYGQNQLSAAKVGDGFWRWPSGSYTNPGPLDGTYTYDYTLEKDFSVAFWHYENLFDDDSTHGKRMLNQGQILISKDNADHAVVTIWGNAVHTSTQVIKPNAWTHIGVTRKNGVVSIYFNGRLDSSKSIANINLLNAHTRLTFAENCGGYDELVLYNTGLSADQMAYIYYKGQKGQDVDVSPPNLVPAKAPVHYWNFDSSSLSGVSPDIYTSAVVGGTSLNQINAVTTGSVDAKVGQSFKIDRFEDSLSGGETQNTVGLPQFLETLSVAPVTLATNFTFAAWVKQPKANSTFGNGVEYTTVIDQWGTTINEQVFQLTYIKFIGSTDNEVGYYILNVRVGPNAGDIRTVTSNLIDLKNTLDWVHVAIRRTSSSVSLYINGKEAGSANFGTQIDPSYNHATRTKLRIGETNSSGYEVMRENGLVVTGSVLAGTSTLTSANSKFKSSLFDHISGTIDVNTGSSTVVGTNTSFLSELAMGDRLLINGEIQTVLSIEDNTHLTLQGTQLIGTVGEQVRPLLPGVVEIQAGTNIVTGTGTAFATDFTAGSNIRIGDEVFTVFSVVTDPGNPDFNKKMQILGTALQTYTDAGYSKEMVPALRVGTQTLSVRRIDNESSLVLSANHAAGATDVVIFTATQTVTDEYRFDGYLDEMAIWDTALTHEQIYGIYEQGNSGIAIHTEPVATYNGVGNTTSESSVTLTLNDCKNYTHVWIGFSTDSTPASGDGGWVACTTAVGAYSKVLNQNSTNNIKIWFKNGGAVSSHTTTVTVIHNVPADTTPPAIPTITQVTGSPTNLSFARYTLSTCSDIAGVFVNLTGVAPSKSDAGWINCTTVASAILSPLLSEGANTVSFWFKDAAGNVTARTDRSITFNPPTLPRPSLHFTMDDTELENGYLRDLVISQIAVPYNTGNITTGLSGFVGEAINFVTNGYYELWKEPSLITNELTVSAWINIAAPTSAATIINKWDGTSANDKYALVVDDVGRICLDLQTTGSTGVWNTSSYRRACSVGKIDFNQWGHIGVIRSAGSIHFYYNNKDVGSEVIDVNNFNPSTLTLRIGAQVRGGSNLSATGLIDELSIWNTAITTTQLEASYGEGLRGNPLLQEMQGQASSVPQKYWDYNSFKYVYPNLSPVTGTMTLADVSPATSTIVSGVDGRVGEAFSLATNNLLQSSDNQLALGTEFSLSTWISTTSTSTMTILNKASPTVAASREFKLYVANRYVKFDYYTTSASGTVTSQTQIPLNDWAHIVVTRKDSDLRLYVNGRLEIVASIGTDPLKDLGTIPFFVGGQSVGGANFFNGKIDETAFWNQALDDRQVKYLYQRGQTGVLAIPTFIVATVAESSNTTTKTTVPISISDCGGFSHVLIQLSGTGAPGSGNPSWQVCSEVIGAITSPILTSGNNTYDVWFKSGVSVEGSATTTLTIRKD